MTTDYVKLLAKLKVSLSTAISKQEYHRLTELDAAVRACVSEGIKAYEADQSLKAEMAIQIRDIMPVYKRVAQACSERSEALQKELKKTQLSKKGASQYLKVAGKLG